jgi:hypothetical protein
MMRWAQYIFGNAQACVIGQRTVDMQERSMALLLKWRNRQSTFSLSRSIVEQTDLAYVLDPTQETNHKKKWHANNEFEKETKLRAGCLRRRRRPEKASRQTGGAL